MKRGLKVDVVLLVKTKLKTVALITPMKRGLKVNTLPIESTS